MTSSKKTAIDAKMPKVALLIACAISMSGCGASHFASRDTNPVIQDYAKSTIFSTKKSVDTFATTASRRLAIFTEDRDGKVLTCAEPPPDVGEVFASAVAAGLKASGEKISGDLAIQYGRAVATQMAPLLYRTQGLQLYRDFIHKLCIDRMNEWISEANYATEGAAGFAQAAELIEAELPVMGTAVGAFYRDVQAGDAKVNIPDTTKVLYIAS